MNPTPTTIDANNIIKKSALDLFTGQIDILQVLVTLVIALALGLVIFAIYRWTFSGVMFSKNFSGSLILLTMITAMVILPITNNIVISLGMVGALSIVRFRTAIKDPMDTVFMFWAIAAGITTGAKYYSVAVVGTLIVGVSVVVISMLKFKKKLPYLLVLRFEERAKSDVQSLLARMPQGNLKSKNVTREYIELTIEMRVRPQDIQTVEKFLAIDGVRDAALISYNGELA
jgi:uncharacterized membrane protein YhiD involved in acid resistance